MDSIHVLVSEQQACIPFSPDEEPDTLFDCRLLQVDTLQNVDPVYKWPPELKYQTAQQMYSKGQQSNMCV